MSGPRPNLRFGTVASAPDPEPLTLERLREVKAMLDALPTAPPQVRATVSAFALRPPRGLNMRLRSSPSIKVVVWFVHPGDVAQVRELPGSEAITWWESPFRGLEVDDG